MGKTAVILVVVALLAGCSARLPQDVGTTAPPSSPAPTPAPTAAEEAPAGPGRNETSAQAVRTDVYNGTVTLILSRKNPDGSVSTTRYYADGDSDRFNAQPNWTMATVDVEMDEAFAGLWRLCLRVFTPAASAGRPYPPCAEGPLPLQLVVNATTLSVPELAEYEVQLDLKPGTAAAEWTQGHFMRWEAHFDYAIPS